MVKIALFGYGKMGKVIDRFSKEKGHEITSIIDPNCSNAQKEINEQTLENADVCIDFSHPGVVIENIKKAAALKKNIVVGTTGWLDNIEEVKKIVQENNIGLIWSGNFSIGVNAFFRIIKYAAKAFNNLEDYDVMGCEYHHKNKADSPSGTAKMIGKILLDNIDRKDKLVYDRLDRVIDPDEIHIASVRGGSIPGIHQIMFDNDADTIELRHTARCRDGFALGALMAAEFIKDKKGFYDIDDLMKDIICR